MTEIWLIRHGMTEGNRYQRYIGKTDELLCEEGKEKLKEFFYPEPEAVFVSPLVRCRETAEILFPEKRLRIIDQLAECDFGDFENKNYLELSGNPDYQAWVDSGGILPFPNGESREEFSETYSGRVPEGCKCLFPQSHQQGGSSGSRGNHYEHYGGLRISRAKLL